MTQNRQLALYNNRTPEIRGAMSAAKEAKDRDQKLHIDAQKLQLRHLWSAEELLTLQTHYLCQLHLFPHHLTTPANSNKAELLL